MHISEIAVKRPITTFMFFVAVLLIGVISFFRLAVDLLPDLSYPRLTIWTKYANVPPQEVEAYVTRKIETALQTTKGVKKISSISQEGLSLVRVDFEWGTNMDFTTLTVREQLDKQYYSSFSEADRPIIIRVDPSSQPVMSLSISSVAGEEGGSLIEHKEFARAIVKRRLEQLDGVALATVTGGLDREIHVDVNVDKMVPLGVSLTDVASALRAANINRPGGYLRKGEYRYSLRTLGEFDDIDQLNEVVVSRNVVNNSIIYLKDVANVSDGFRERDNITKYDGKESIGVIVQKESGSNTVAVSKQVMEVLGQLETEFPDVKISVAYDQAEFISSSINNVRLSILFGGILAFLVLFLFLHDLRNPVIISIAIPLSIFATFILLYFTNVSLNIMSLGGIALGVGLLVDNSIVVIENIFRHRQEGKGIIEAAIVGSKEISMAVSASTFTTVSVFFPIIFVEGVAGQLFRDQSLAITFALTCSLLVSLTLLPMLASHFFHFKKKTLEPIIPLAPMRKADEKKQPDLDEGAIKEEPGTVIQILKIIFFPFKLIFYYLIYRPIIYYFLWRAILYFLVWKVLLFNVLWRFIIKMLITTTFFLVIYLLYYWFILIVKSLNYVLNIFNPVFEVFDGYFQKFAAAYERALQWALDNRGNTLAITAIMMVLAVLLGITLDRELMPQVDQRQFEIETFLPVGSTLEQTDRVTTTIIEWLLDKDLQDDVESVFSSVGIVQEKGLQSERTTSLNRGLILVRLKGSGSYTTEEVMQIIRDKEYLISEASINFSAGETTLQQVLGTEESDIVVNIKGEDFDITSVMVDSLIDKMSLIEGLADIHSSYEEGKPEIRIKVRRQQAERYGLSVNRVSSFISNSMGGNTATQFTDFDRKIDIVVRPHVSFRDEFDDVLDSYIPQGKIYIPIRELIDFEFTEGPNEIRRENQVRQIQIFANIHERDYKNIISDISTAISEIELPGKDYDIELGGENEEMRRSFRSLILALLVSIALVYMILAAQFESLLQPFIIMFAIPLAMIGVSLALFLTNNSINVLSAIGVIILVGIVVNDAIIKIDFINKSRQKGTPLREAIMEAGKKRLRPIIMTTVTTVLALTPMAFGLVGKGAGLQGPLAIAVIGGLLSSTFLTLIVIPVIYSFIGGFKVKA